MNNLEYYVQQKLNALKRLHLERHLRPIQRERNACLTYNGKRCISFACNDYLGLSQHKDVILAAKEAVLTYGTGGCSSRYITGDTPLLHQLERKIADFKETEDCIVFGSGYLANLSIISALMGKNDLIVMDALSHACMIDGARLSRAKIVCFRHNNTHHLEHVLSQERHKFRHALILTETVFSMDGDCAPLEDIASIAKKYTAWLMTDDAHGFGVLGHGKGGVHACAHKPDIPLQMGTLSKAIGAYGGYLCASKPICRFLRNKCRSALYSTALPPAVIAAADRAIDIIRENPHLTHKPLKHARLFCKILNFPEAQTPIVPLILGPETHALQAQKILEAEGFLTIAIRPPTVPRNTSRLRFTFSALHTTKHIQQLAKILLKHKFSSCLPKNKPSPKNHQHTPFA